jgi:hypothetical protein
MIINTHFDVIWLVIRGYIQSTSNYSNIQFDYCNMIGFLTMNIFYNHLEYPSKN